jgi:inner membrane protein
MDPLVAGAPLMNTLAIAGLGFSSGALGVLSHILGDILTPMGVNPRQPFGGEVISLNVVYASNEMANNVLSVIGGVALVVAMYAGISM